MAHFLVLEDERIVRNIVTLLLRQNRHSVRQAGTLDHAEQICHDYPIDVLVADVQLGAGRSGTEFAVRLVSAQPKIKCLFISGRLVKSWDSKDQANFARIPERSCASLCKPFSPDALLRAIGNLLSSAEPIAEQVETVDEIKFPDLQPNCWLGTMFNLISGVYAWLQSGERTEESWKLYTATTRLCLAEMNAVASTETDFSYDSMGEDLKQVIPCVQAALVALESRNRQTASRQIRAGLLLFSPVQPNQK